MSHQTAEESQVVSDVQQDRCQVRDECQEPADLLRDLERQTLLSHPVDERTELVRIRILLESLFTLFCPQDKDNIVVVGRYYSVGVLNNFDSRRFSDSTI